MKVKYPAAKAREVGEELVAELQPLCERIEICGSLRRKLPDVGDVEILFVPKMKPARVTFFEWKDIPATENQFDLWLDNGTIEKRFGIKGAASWGKLNKLSIECRSGIPVDFFATTMEHWWMSLVIRTGGKQNNIALAQGAHKLGRRLLPYGGGVEDIRTGERTLATSERHAFELCGCEYLPPKLRA